MRQIRGVTVLDYKGRLTPMYVESKSTSDALFVVRGMTTKQQIRLKKLTNKYTIQIGVLAYEHHDEVNSEVSLNDYWEEGIRVLAMVFFNSKESSSKQFEKKLFEEIEIRMCHLALMRGYETIDRRN